MFKLGILGLGKMGSAILSGVIDSGIYNTNDIMFYTPNKDHQDKYISLGFTLAKNELDLFNNSKMILIAIKPQMFDQALECAKELDFTNRCVVSIAAGKSIKTIEGFFKNATVVRAMPNTPAMIKCASITACANNENELFDDAIKMFNSIGSASKISENQMDETLPLNGSMPAYLYLFAKGFIERAIENGIDPEVAKVLTCNAIIGSAKMILESSDDIDTLIKNVCSKGGTTIEGLNHLTNGSFTSDIHDCYDACVRRSKELNKG